MSAPPEVVEARLNQLASKVGALERAIKDLSRRDDDDTEAPHDRGQPWHCEFCRKKTLGKVYDVVGPNGETTQQLRILHKGLVVVVTSGGEAGAVSCTCTGCGHVNLVTWSEREEEAPAAR